MGLLKETLNDIKPNKENKYIINIRCSIWDKYSDVRDALEVYKTACCIPSSCNVFSLYSAYEHYTNKVSQHYIVSKRYFEMVARDTLGALIDEYGIISGAWCN